MFVDEASADRVARDLHDVVMQRLFSVGLQLHGLAGMLGVGPAGDVLAEAVAGLEQTMADVRAAIVALRDAGADGRPGLRSALLAGLADGPAVEPPPAAEVAGG